MGAMANTATIVCIMNTDLSAHPFHKRSKWIHFRQRCATITLLDLVGFLVPQGKLKGTMEDALPFFDFRHEFQETSSRDD